MVKLIAIRSTQVHWSNALNSKRGFPAQDLYAGNGRDSPENLKTQEDINAEKLWNFDLQNLVVSVTLLSQGAVYAATIGTRAGIEFLAQRLHRQTSQIFQGPAEYS